MTIYPITRNEKLDALNRLGELETKVQRVFIQEKSYQLDFNSQAEKHFEPLDKAVTNKSQENLTKSKAKTETTEENFKNITENSNASANATTSFYETLKCFRTICTENSIRGKIEDKILKKSSVRNLSLQKKLIPIIVS